MNRSSRMPKKQQQQQQQQQDAVPVKTAVLAHASAAGIDLGGAGNGRAPSLTAAVAHSGPPPTVREAMAALLGWVDGSIKALQATRWTESVDHEGRVLYTTIGNPNGVIDPVLWQYRSSVERALHVVVEELRPAMDGQSDSGSGGGKKRSRSTEANGEGGPSDSGASPAVVAVAGRR